MDWAAGRWPRGRARPLTVASRTWRVSKDCGCAWATTLTPKTIAMTVENNRVSLRITICSLNWPEFRFDEFSIDFCRKPALAVWIGIVHCFSPGDNEFSTAKRAFRVLWASGR